MRVPSPNESAPASPPPADTSLAKWQSLTEALIFACVYWDYPVQRYGGYGEYLRICARSGKRFSEDVAKRYCRALAEAINTEFAHIEAQPGTTSDGRTITPTRLLRAHAANDSASFRLRYAHLLPKRPRTPTPAERRTGVSEEQRMREADELAASL